MGLQRDSEQNFRTVLGIPSIQIALETLSWVRD